MATSQNFSCYQGEDVTVTVSLSPATNITGWSLAFTVKRQYGDAAALIAKTVGSGITVVNAATGVFAVALASADTNNANVGPGAYPFEITRTDGGSRTVLTIGTFTVLPAVAL